MIIKNLKTKNILKMSDEKKQETLDNYKTNVYEYDTLVVSGGSIKGLTALGSIQYLYDNFLNEKLEKFIGTSCGSIICYLLSIGYTPVEIIVYICTHHLIEKIQEFNLLDMINGNGATSYHYINDMLEKMTLDKIGRLITLGELKEKYKKIFICVTYNITLDKTEYLSWENYPELPCLIAIRMSSNIPLLFDTFKYMDNYYLDGALKDNFPLEKAQEIGSKVIGIVLRSKEPPPDNPSNKMLEYFFGIISLFIKDNTDIQITKKNEKTTIINLYLTKSYHMFDFFVKSRDKLEMFSEGYQIIKKEFENVK
jgi:predicted acylesterase/phospholipase RssA